MKKGLGRGLESLFSIYEEDEDIKTSEQTKNNSANKDVAEIDIKLIDPDMNQPRKRFDPNSLKELAESIKIHGVIQPIIVNQNENGRFTIIAGERRFRASLIAGKSTIPAIIKNYTSKQIKEVALVENLQREDLNPIEAARAIQQLMEVYNFTQEDVADRIGKSRPLVANTLRLLTLPAEILEMIEKNKISAGHGRCLVVIEDKQEQIELANIAADKKLSVRDLEKLAKNYHQLKNKPEKVKQIQTPELKEFCHKMQRIFKTKVKIAGNEIKGKIIIDYYNQDDIDRIYNIINKIERL